MITKERANVWPANSNRDLLLTWRCLQPELIGQMRTHNTYMYKKHFFAFWGILSLAVLIICQAGQAQVLVPAFVQFASQNNGGNDLPTCTATFPSNNTAGDLIVVAVTLVVVVTVA